jgi:hypothetical protein
LYIIALLNGVYISDFGNNNTMNKRITIPKKVTSAIIENLNNELHASPEQVDLFIPPSVTPRGFGVIPSIYLLLFTWMRRRQGALIIDIDSSNKEEVAEFVESYFGYIIIITVWKNNEILAPNGESIKKALRACTPKMRDRLDLLQDLPNSELVIANFDHYSEALGLSHWFYIRDYKFAEAPSELDNTTYRIIETLGQIYRTKLRTSIKDVLDPTTRIIWELMANTHQHATKDYLDQATLSPNTRGLYLKIHESNKVNFIQNADDELGLSQYYERNLTDGRNYVLEISIFDSGPGLVKRFLGKDWNEKQPIAEDVRTIKICLLRGVSSVKGPDSMKKGYGLDEVLQVLDKKRGFLKVRTGRTCLYRDLVATPYLHAKTPEEVELFDSGTQSNDRFTEYDWIEGTQITMAYPLI